MKTIAIGSGKGGVGKSSISALIAYALKQLGYSVGLMDADIFGPSVPHILGIVDGVVSENDLIQPVYVDGIATLSVGNMCDPNSAIIWRGPLIHNMLDQMLNHTNWSDESGKKLDYLIIDMPPGTGDVPISLNQLTTLNGSVVVCTPQKVALIDAVRAVNMTEKMESPLLGVIENMSYFLCDGCNKKHDIFGSGGVKAYAQEKNLPFLGDVPFSPEIRKNADEGTLFAAAKNPVIAECFTQIAKKLIEQIQLHPVMPKLNMAGN